MTERTVTVHIAIECIVEDDTDALTIGQVVLARIPDTDLQVNGSDVLTRGLGLIRVDEKFVDPDHDQVAT